MLKIIKMLLHPIQTLRDHKIHIIYLLIIANIIIYFIAFQNIKQFYNSYLELLEQPTITTTIERKNELTIEPKVKNSVVRTITMYNSVEEQTDNSPCLSADNTNICEVDYNVCATNAYPFGTVLRIDKLGTCVVKDRMNSRYKNEVDWYAKMDVDRALNFGRQNLLVEEIYN